MSRPATAVALILIVALAAAARSLRLEHVFLDDGSVIFAIGDAFYHAHRAWFSFQGFPDFLRFDPCINWPEGAPVPHAPLYDLALAGLARLFSSTHSPANFERVIAWVPVVLGAITVLPVYALARGLRGRAAGLGAACLYSVLPIAISYSQVGNPDHHAAVGLEGAVLLALYCAALTPNNDTRRLAWIAAGLALARAALLGTWHGSLLYFPIGEGALLLVGVLHDRRPLLIAQALSLLASCALIAPLVASTATPVAGPWSATELSLLHLLSLTGVATLAVAGVLAQGRWPLASPQKRFVRLCLGALAVAGLALALPGVWDGIVPALEFLSKRDDWGSGVLEQMSLFHQQGEVRVSAGVRHLGYYAYLLPLAPVSFWLLSNSPNGPALRSRALFMLTWTSVFGAMAVFQMRFGNDFAAAFCVAFACLLAAVGEDLSRRWGLSKSTGAAISLALGAALWSPSVWHFFQPALRDTVMRYRGLEVASDFALTTVSGTQVRFAERVLSATPATPGCDGTRDVPEYGILATPALGHVLHRVAHRATPADPFGPYIGEPAYRDVLTFFRTQSEEEAVRVAQQLRTPFVALADDIAGEPRAVIHRRLMAEDGSGDGKLQHLEHFRLVTESAAGGVPFRVAFESETLVTIPYKLFEIVEGAVLEAEVSPGERVKARLAVTTPSGRRFHFFASARAGEDGLARLRVPYWTGGSEPTRALGRYRLQGGGKRWIAAPSEDDVREGRAIRLVTIFAISPSPGTASPSLKEPESDAGRP